VPAAPPGRREEPRRARQSQRRTRGARRGGLSATAQGVELTSRKDLQMLPTGLATIGRSTRRHKALAVAAGEPSSPGARRSSGTRTRSVTLAAGGAQITERGGAEPGAQPVEPRAPAALRPRCRGSALLVAARWPGSSRMQSRALGGRVAFAIIDHKDQRSAVLVGDDGRQLAKTRAPSLRARDTPAPHALAKDHAQCLMPSRIALSLLSPCIRSYSTDGTRSRSVRRGRCDVDERLDLEPGARDAHVGRQ